MKEWLKNILCFHKWEHIEIHAIHNTKTEPPYFMSTYRCKKCGKFKSNYTYT